MSMCIVPAMPVTLPVPGRGTLAMRRSGVPPVHRGSPKVSID